MKTASFKSFFLICLLLAISIPAYSASSENRDVQLVMNPTRIKAIAFDRNQYYDLNHDGVIDVISGTNVCEPYSNIDPENTPSSEVVAWAKLPDNNPITEWSHFTDINNDNFIDVFTPWQGVYIADSYNNWPHTLPVSLNSNDQVSLMDCTGDTRLEVIVNEKEVWTLNRDNVWELTNIKIMTDKEYLGIKQAQADNGYDLGSGMDIWRPGGSSYSMDYLYIDIDNDGITDYVDTSSGTCFYNKGNGILVKKEFGGSMIFRDLNNDGIMDYVIYDDTALKCAAYITQDNGSVVEHTLISGLHCSKNIWCYDFDKDGDVDILIPLDYKGRDNGNNNYTNGISCLIIMENNGDATFQKHEIMTDGEVYFAECMDMDADGCYEVLALKAGDGYYSYKITDELSVSETRILEYMWEYSFAYGLPSVICGDILSTGQMAMAYDGDYNHSGDYIFLWSDAVNEAPVMATAPTYLYNQANGTLDINWTRGTDKESSSVDLTYELRIGTTPGGGDILSAHACADGRRRNLKDGANGYSTRRILDVRSWPAGKYYISVQAVDPNRQGSAFSPYAVFEKTDVSTDFIFINDCNFGIGDIAKFSMSAKPADGISYRWEIPGGEIINYDDASGVCNARFTTGGNKTVTLKAFKGTDLVGSTTQTIAVKSANFKKGNIGNTIQLALDMDADGACEIYTGSKFMEGDESGAYKNIGKIYNTNLPEGEYVAADINRDGLADIFINRNVTKRYAHGINMGNKDIEFSGDYVSDSETTNVNVDINNDGVEDYVYFNQFMAHFYTALHINSGNYIDFTYKEMDVIAGEQILYDYNGDGLIDIIQAQEKSFVPYINNGDLTFTEQAPITTPTTLKAIADIDGNGKPDYICFQASENYGISINGTEMYVVWNGGESTTEIPCRRTDRFNKVLNISDYNNDGILDLLLETNDDEAQVGQKLKRYSLNLFADHSYELNECDIHDIYDITLFYRTDGRPSLDDHIIANVMNEAPSAPTALRASQTGNSVVIEWNPATDKESHASQLKYNISIRHKEATGADSYLFSPLNSAKNGVAVPSSRQLLTATKFTIPIANIPAGEYEVQVQAVDPLKLAGNFSEVFVLNVKEQSVIEAPTTTAVGTAVTVKVYSNITDAPDFGEDATFTRLDDSSYSVVWSTEGMKRISIGTDSSEIYVLAAADAGFSLPSRVLNGATVRIDGNNLNVGKWEISNANDNWIELNSSDIASLTATGATDATITIGSVGAYQIRHTVSDPYSIAEHIATVTVTDINATPDVAPITVDATTNKNIITWDIPADLSPDVVSVNIYKETSELNQFERIATLDINDGSYTDTESFPSIKSSRYYLSYNLTYGESASSNVHNTMHLMINRGLAGAYNLVWNKYEGINITSYRIMAGETPEQLDHIDTVSGALNSYTFTPTTTQRYFAVIMQTERENTLRTISRAGETDQNSVRSNVISIADAIDAFLIEKITIASNQEAGGFNVTTGGTLQLRAMIQPVNATIRNIVWSSSDESIASVDENGKLCARTIGDVTITATATDGSGVKGSVEINVYSIPVTSVEVIADKTSIAVGETLALSCKVLPDNASCTDVVWSSSDENIATVDDSGTVKAIKAGNVIITAASTDGSGVKGSVEINVYSIPVTSVEVIADKTSITVGETLALSCKVLPDNASCKDVVWSSSDENIATIDGSGILTGLAEGQIIAMAEAVGPTLNDIMISDYVYITITPAAGIGTIEITPDTYVVIYNLSGSLVFEGEFDQARLIRGIYIVKSSNTVSKLYIK